MTLNVTWSESKNKWMVHSTTEGHIGYRKTRKKAKKKALGVAQTEADRRGTQVQVRWHGKEDNIVGDRLVYPKGTDSDEEIR